MEEEVGRQEEERKEKRNELAQWLLLVPLILLLLFGCGTCGMMRGQTAHADTRSQMNADYSPWPFMVLHPVNPDIIEEIRRDAEYYPGPGSESGDPIVEPGDFWETSTPTSAATLADTPTATELASATTTSTATEPASATASSTITATSSPSSTATATDTGTPESSSTPSSTPSLTNTPTETSVPWPPPPVPPPGPPPNTYWFYDDVTPFSYMMYSSIPNGNYRSGSSATFYSPQFLNGQRLLGGTTTVRFYAYNPSASPVSLSVELRAGSTVLGSASFALPANVTSAYFFSASISTIEHDFITGQRLILRLTSGSPSAIFWDGDYHYSGVQIPAVVTVPTPTSTRTPTATRTATITDTPTITNTPLPTNTTAPPAATATNTPVPSDTPGPTSTSTLTATSTDTPLASDTPTSTATSTDTPASTATPTPTDTATAASTDTPTSTSTDTPIATSTETPTATSTETPTATSTDTPTATSTETPTPTSTETPTPTSTETPTPTSTETPTPTSTDTPTPTPTSTDTPTPTATETPTPTSTETPTPTSTETPTPTATETPTPTPTDTPTPTSTNTPTPTATATTPPWWDCDWDYRIQLTFDNLAQSENLNDFPILVTLNSGRIDYGQTQDMGQDIRFVDSDGVTVLAYEIEDWNESGDSYVWVDVPRIDGASNTDYIWMYYGNSTVGDGQDAGNTWVNYRGIWHLNEDQVGTGNAGLYQDSTSNGFDGDDQISATGKNGQIAAGQEFDGVDDYIYLGTTDIVDGTDTFTFTAWVNISSLPLLNGHYGVYSRFPGVDNGSLRVMVGQWAAANDSHLDISTNNGTWHDMLANSQAPTGTWTYLAAVYDGSGTVNFYFDGSPDGSVAYIEPSVVAGADQFVGTGEPGLFHIEGYIDELRLSNVYRSADWIAAQFDSMSDTFISYGGEEPSTAYCPVSALQILVAGAADASGNADFATLRYTEDGALDGTFDGDGIATVAIGAGDDVTRDIAIQSDDKIVVVGWNVVGAGNHDISVVRYNDDGSLDTSFDANGIVSLDIAGNYDHANAVAIQPDGKIVVIGSTYNGTDNDFAVVRYNSDGSLDTTFDANGVVTTNVNSAENRGLAGALQTDGKIVVGGWGYVGGDANFMVLRYNTDGSLDTTFDGNGIASANVGAGEDEEARAMVLQPDGKIILAGFVINNSSGHERLALVRFNSDGSLDTTFDGDGIVTTNVSVGDNEGAYGITLQSDGKIVVAGYADTDVDFAVLRYNEDGSLDTTFDGDGMLTTDIFSGGDDWAYDVEVQSDGAIVVAGFGTNGNTYVAVVRYNTDGSLDTTFDTDGIVTTDIVAGDDEARALVIQ